MNLLHHIARAYMHQRLSPPSYSTQDRDRRSMGEDPFRWIRDIGSDLGRSGPAGVRASDADREEVVTFLKRHCAEGRLSTDELTSRVEAAYTAVSLADLDRLSTDLPGSPVETATPSRSIARPRAVSLGAVAHVGAIGVGLLVLLALASLLAPPEVWATVLVPLMLVVMLAAASILPFALPVVALLLLVGAGRRPPALPRRDRRSVLLDGRHGRVHVWRW